MTQEEKAKAYDEAIEKIKYVMEHGVSPVLNKEDLQEIFPELVELKDERIRKGLITIYRDIPLYSKFIDDVRAEDIIKWLEKQGEKPKWTEEDVIRLDRICKTLWKNRKGDTDEIYQQEQDFDWLNSLKQRMEA